jgi:phage terminase small subunit
MQTTHLRRTQSFELQQELRSLLEGLNQSITAEADSNRIANQEVLHRDRDRAFNQMEQMEQKIRSAATESRKRKQQKEYKHCKGEWIELEKDIAKKRNIAIDESRFVDDKSFMSLDDDDLQCNSAVTDSQFAK